MPCWQAINVLHDDSMIVESSKDSNADFSIDETSQMASHHRTGILEAATRFSSHYRRPKLKRKQGMEEDTTTELPKSMKRAKRSSPPTSNGEPYVIRAPPTNDVKVSKKPRTTNNTSVKRYLQPTKPSALNGMTKSANPTQNSNPTSRNHMFDGRPPCEIQMLVEETDNCERVKLPVLENKSAVIPSLRKEGHLDLMDTDVENFFTEDPLDETDFDNAMELCIGKTHTRRVQQLPSPALSQADKEYARGSIVQGQHAITVGTAAHSITPFLRLNDSDLVQTIKYSPIPQLHSSFHIRTCFRIAEAAQFINTKANNNMPAEAMTVELFAFALAAPNDSGVRTFRFSDLFFPNQPPFLTGTGCRIESIFDTRHGAASSERQMTSSKSVLCRAIVRLPPIQPSGRSANYNPLKKTCTSLEPGTVCKVRIDAIRESNWEEVEYVRGIVDPKTPDLERKDDQMTG